MSDWNTWIITTEERVKHDAQFQFLKPVNGFVTGDQVKLFFLKSGLPPIVLGQIWSLADLDADGKLDKKEFSIAMFLIKKKLEGMPLPLALPRTLKSDPQPVFPASSTDTLSLSIVPFETQSSLRPERGGTNGFLNSLSGSAHSHSLSQPDSDYWVLAACSRPKYRMLFNQHDRTKRGYLTGLEARAIFLQSGLSQQILAHIWSLADSDKDGNLTCDEFCVASFLIEKALSGSQLPTALHSGSLSSQSRTPNQVQLGSNDTSSGDETKAPPLSFEDKRRENFRQGQAELDRRKQELSETLRKEEEARLEKERQERERQDKIRLEKERQKAMDAEQQAERLRELEAQREVRRRQAVESRMESWRAAEAQRQLEAEKQRVEALKKEKMHAHALLEQAIAHRASLVESASSQELRRRDFEARLLACSAEVETHKTAIMEMRSKRDTFERDIRELTEQVEAAKAELTRWQREREKLNLRLSTGVDMNTITEQYKTLTATRESRRGAIKQLKSQLLELDESMTLQGQQLATRRNIAVDLEHRSSKLNSELHDLRQELESKSRAHQGSKSASTRASPLDAVGNADSNKVEYEVMYDFSARHPDELSLTSGTVVQVSSNSPIAVAPGWMYGECGGRKGLFPESYVRKRITGAIDPFDPFGVHKANAADLNGSITKESNSGTQVTKPKSDISYADWTASKTTSSAPHLFTCVALYAFESTVEGDLNLAVGDIVHVHAIRGEWWEGVCKRTNLSGLFPANYARKLTAEEIRLRKEQQATTASSSGSDSLIPSNATPGDPPQLPSTGPTTQTHHNSAPSSPVNTSSPSEDVVPSTKPEFARVIAPYTATSTGQISLQLGQVVQLRKRSTKGWWEGEIQQRGRGRQFGWFPADYVRLIPSVSSLDGATNSNAGIVGSSVQPVTSDLTAACSDTSSNAVTKLATASSVATSVRTSSLTTSTSSPTTKPAVELMQAIFSYKAAHADELTFDEGSIITVLGRDEPEWWRGRLHSSGLEGLFPVNYVRPYNSVVVNGGNAPKPLSYSVSSSQRDPASSISFAPLPLDWTPEVQTKTRGLAINELIDSEETYASGLLEVWMVFYQPLLKSDLLTEEQLQRIFPNWMSLYHFSCELSSTLRERVDVNMDPLVSSEVCIGDILSQRLPKFHIFLEYCLQQEAAVGLLQSCLAANRDLKHFVSECEQNTRTKGLFLSSYLLKPVQRLTKYLLLLDRVYQNTDPSHPDRAMLRNVQSQLRIILAQVDSAVGCHSASRRVEWLRNHLIGDRGLMAWLYTSVPPNSGVSTQLLHYGTVFKPKSRKELVAFLFTHYLLLTSPSYPTRRQPFEFPLLPTEAGVSLRMYKKPILLREIFVSAGTSLKDVEVNRLYTSLSALTSAFPRTSSLSGDICRVSSKSLSSSLSEDTTTSLQLSTVFPTQTLFSLFPRAHPKRPLISLRATSVMDRDRWIMQIWNAIRKSVRFSLPLPDRVETQRDTRTNCLQVSVLRVWTSHQVPIEIRFQFAVDNHVRSGCTVLTNESFRGPISLNLTYSEDSQPSHLCVWAFERSEKFEFNELGQCVLSLSKSSQLPDMPSDRVSMRSVRFSSPKTELRADLRLCFIWI